MYDKLQNMLTAHRTYAAALAALYELVHAEKRASSLMHPSSWTVYNTKLRAAQGRVTESYSAMEKLFGKPVFQAAVALFGQGEYAIEMALQAKDPEDGEIGYGAVRTMAGAKEALQLSMADIKVSERARSIRDCSKESAQAIRAEIAAAATVRDELSETATALGLAEKQDYKNARADYHAALSALETRLDTLEALLARKSVEGLAPALTTFVSFVSGEAGEHADSEWTSLVDKARPLFT